MYTVFTIVSFQLKLAGKTYYLLKIDEKKRENKIMLDSEDFDVEELKRNDKVCLLLDIYLLIASIYLNKICKEVKH